MTAPDDAVARKIGPAEPALTFTENAQRIAPATERALVEKPQVESVDREQNPLAATLEPAKTDAPEQIPVQMVGAKGAGGREVISFVVRLSNRERIPLKRDAAREAIVRALLAAIRAGGRFGTMRFHEQKNPRDGETYLFGMCDVNDVRSRHGRRR